MKWTTYFEASHRSLFDYHIYFPQGEWRKKLDQHARFKIRALQMITDMEYENEALVYKVGELELKIARLQAENAMLREDTSDADCVYSAMLERRAEKVGELPW